ncbi:MAG TPA: PEP-CTERM sorting domain-containing protein, partial [Myxococcota bacterium]|nr:PEP-CTERM sorting domain-containing protein [Myxococcota bacterium]
DDGTLPAVLAHERGHNACQPHVASAECQLMQPAVFNPGQGGCLAASECTNMKAARTTTSSGQECGCFASGGGLEADGSFCADVAGGGVCSGGACGEYGSDASVELLVAADPGLLSGGPPNDALRIAALAGDWSVLGAFTRTPASGAGPTLVRGMTYASDSDTVFGVVPTVGDDEIVTIDRVSGTVLDVIGTLANGTQEIVSMAYDPGPTTSPGDDRLLVLEVDGSAGEFRAIDPAQPSTATLLGSLPWQPAGSFTGLAYDSIQDRLFAIAEVGFTTGLWEVDLGSCPPSPCTTTEVGTTSFFRESPSLDYSPQTGMLYLVGEAFSGARVFYDVIDPTTFTSPGTLSLDVFSPAALAVVPEPALGAGLAIGGVVIVVTARRRRPQNPPARE